MSEELIQRSTHKNCSWPETTLPNTLLTQTRLGQTYKQLNERMNKQTKISKLPIRDCIKDIIKLIKLIKLPPL